MLYLIIAFRNIFRQKRRSILTGLTMAFGYVFVSFSLSLSEGSYNFIIDRFTRTHSGHLKISTTDYFYSQDLYQTIDQTQGVIDVLQQIPSIKSFAPRVYSGAMALVDQKTTGARLMGVDFKREPQTTTLAQQLAEGDFFDSDQAAEVLVGFGVARILKAKVGGELALITQGADGLIANEIFKIRGVIGKDDSSPYKDTVVLPLGTLQSFLELGNKWHELVIINQNLNQAQGVMEQLNQRLPPNLEAYSWQKVHQDFYKGMQQDKAGNNITLTILMLLVGLSVLNTILMSTLERSFEYGLMRALGTRPINLFWMIVMEALLICGFSLMVGTVLALAVNGYFANVGIVLSHPMDMAGIKFDRLLGEISYQTMVVPYGMVIGTTLLVSLIPAIRAALITPIHAMKS